MRATHRTLAALVVPVTLLSGCGGSPPASDAREAVRNAVFADNPQAYAAGADGAEVVGVKIAAWTRARTATATGLPERYESTWTATLRLKEPLAVILRQIDGTRIVRVVADKAEEIPFQGTLGAMNLDGTWQIHAFSSGEPWKAMWDKTGGVTMGYEITDRGNIAVAFRNTTFVPLSKLEPHVIEGSDQWQKMLADAAETQRKAREAHAERVRLQRETAEAQQRSQQAALAAQRKQAEEAAAERQRIAAEQSAEQRRKAQEAAGKRADDARRARLEPTIEPFRSSTGLLLTTATGPTSLITGARVDEVAFTASGRGIDLREMPFREFGFESSTDERGTVTLKTSLAEAPMQFRAGANNSLASAGITLTPLADADRARLDATIALGKRLGSVAPLAISPEIIDPAALVAREADLRLAGLTGTVLYRDRVDTRVNPLFAGDLTQRRAYAWRDKQIVAIRLAEPIRGSGLYYRGSAATNDLIVTINGVHTVALASVPKLGAAVIPLPTDLEILDIRLEARGSASARTIGLLK